MVYPGCILVQSGQLIYGKVNLLALFYCLRSTCSLPCFMPFMERGEAFVMSTFVTSKLLPYTKKPFKMKMSLKGNNLP